MTIPKPVREMGRYALWFGLIALLADPVLALGKDQIIVKAALGFGLFVGSFGLSLVFSWVVIDPIDLWLRRTTRDPLWLMTYEGKSWLASAEGQAWSSSGRG
jgi:hypothetical protein